MKVTIQPSAISGHVSAPASKSVAQRVFALALMHTDVTHIEGAGNSEDEKAALSIIKQLGTNCVQREDGSLVITGSDWFQKKSVRVPEMITLNCGESGLSMRMFTAIAALIPTPIIVSAKGSLLLRPMNFFETVFPALGVEIKTNEGFAPIEIRGPLQPADLSLDGSLSSQFLTGLLMAMGKRTRQRITLNVQNLVSTPYIDLTLQMMQDFGYCIQAFNYERFEISASVQPQQPIYYTIEGDWSGAAFIMVAGALHGRATVSGLRLDSAQADRAILDVLEIAGAKISIENNNITVQQSRLQSFEFDASHCPDLFPPLVALALGCEGRSAIKGVQRLLHKESNRAEALQNEFQKMGAVIVLQEDWMYIEGKQPLIGAKVDARNDHRIAMALAVAAPGAQAETQISGAESVKKSYPHFFQDMQQLNAKIQVFT